MENLNNTSPPSILPLLKKYTDEINFNMASDQQTGALLRVLASSKPGGHFLEIGTGTGIGTAWLLSGMDETATILSLDSDPTVHNIAKKAFNNEKRLTLITEDAHTFIKEQKQHSFDLIFGDAIPGKYELLEETLTLVKPGGFYVIDDMLPQSNWPENHAPRVTSLINELKTIENFVAVSLKLGSGIIILTRLT